MKSTHNEMTQITHGTLPQESNFKFISKSAASGEKY